MEGIIPVIAFFAVMAMVSAIGAVVKKSASAYNDGAQQANRPQNAPRKMQAAQRLERAQAVRAAMSGEMNFDPYTGKPVRQHSTDDCTGGSIHDGYHEGTAKSHAPASGTEGRQGAQGVRSDEYAFGRAASSRLKTDNGLNVDRGMNKKPSQSAASVPKQTAAEPRQRAAEAAKNTAASGFDRLAEALRDKPAAVQGVVWAEILGKTLADRQAE